MLNQFRSARRNRAAQTLVAVVATLFVWTGPARAQVHTPDSTTPDSSPQGPAIDTLVDPVHDGVYGSGHTLIAFLDRTDAASEAEFPVLMAVAGAGDVRVVVKELPLRDQLSLDVAGAVVRARMAGTDIALRLELALAAAHPDTADKLHSILDATRSGDVVPGAKETDAITGYFRKTRYLADDIGIRGTPFFVGSSGVLAGPQSYDALHKLAVGR